MLSVSTLSVEKTSIIMLVLKVSIMMSIKRMSVIMLGVEIMTVTMLRIAMLGTVRRVLFSRILLQ
jgi:hypothetical protein